MFRHLGRRGSRKGCLADERRRTLTQVNVIAERRGPLVLSGVLFAAVFAWWYARSLLPSLLEFGKKQWEANALEDSLQARPGGSFSDVSWEHALLCSVAYTSLVLLGVRRMERQPPVRCFIFECMAVYNCTQCLINCYCCAQLCLIGSTAGVDAAALDEVRRPWAAREVRQALGEPRDHAIGRQVWLQYHCRQLELLGTVFMVLRKKFDRVSYLHLYLRVLNLWGWYFGCRFACDTSYFPALITAACQATLYFYYSLSSFGIREVPIFKKARLTEVQLLQYILCTVHNVLAAVRGQLLWSLALLHLFVIANGVMLYVDFHMDEKTGDGSGPRGQPAEGGSGRRRRQGAEPHVAFSFDSCGWLMVYHFGVAYWLQQQIMPGITKESAGSDRYPKGIRFSGSSGGALVGCVLASGANAKDVFEFILLQQPACLKDPTQMFPAVRRALERYQYEGAHRNLSGRLRVLLTRISWQPPFVMGEVVDQFPDNDTALDTLCASCHVPVMAGILPYPICGPSGTRYYYDGMAWPSSLLVPWRGARGDKIVRVSAMSAPLSDIRNTGCPLWWGLFAPNLGILRGMFWSGYRDAALWFSVAPEETSEMCWRRDPRPAAADARRAEKAPDLDTSQTEEDEGDGLRRQDTGSNLARWHAAQGLLSRPLPPVATQIPAVDPASGEDVLVLIKRFEAAVATANKVTTWLAVAAVVALLAVGMSYSLNYSPVILR